MVRKQLHYVRNVTSEKGIPMCSQAHLNFIYACSVKFYFVKLKKFLLKFEA